MCSTQPRLLLCHQTPLHTQNGELGRRQTANGTRKGRSKEQIDEGPVDLLAEVLTPQQQRQELLNAPLERAAAEGMMVLAQTLVGAGAETLVMNLHQLHTAFHGGHGDIVRSIVNDLQENGSSIVAGKDTLGRTPVHVRTSVHVAVEGEEKRDSAADVRRRGWLESMEYNIWMFRVPTMRRQLSLSWLCT